MRGFSLNFINQQKQNMKNSLWFVAGVAVTLAFQSYQDHKLQKRNVAEAMEIFDKGIKSDQEWRDSLSDKERGYLWQQCVDDADGTDMALHQCDVEFPEHLDNQSI